MATFGALDFLGIGIPIDYYITFEQPRVGNPEFAAYFHQKIPNAIRITHGYDVVVNWPL